MLTGTLIQNKPINVKAYRNCVRAAGAKHRKTRHDGKVAFHTALMEQSPLKVKKQMERATAACWLDNLTIRYGWRPSNLPDHCDGCGAGLTLEHGLSCKQGGLIGIYHGDVHDECSHLCGIALTDS
ncbi:hypothetical protein ACHAW6_000286 [Cyclotella cf. meneghiniana]